MTKLNVFLITLLVIFLSYSFRKFPNGAIDKEEKFIKTELYFGLNKTDGSRVSEKEWESFSDTVISKIFFKGTTTMKSEGRWLSGDSLIKEDSRVVIYFSRIYEMTDEFSGSIDTLREKYKRYFLQEAVLRTDEFISASF